MSSSTRVIGADVTKAGWAAVTVVGGTIAGVDVYESMGALTRAESEATVIAVDIPIGLPEIPPRRADVEAKRFVGPRSSSVFPTLPRDVLEAQTYDEARRISRDRYGVGVSAQSYALRHRILETDIVASTDGRLIEIHPEVSFAALAGEPLDYPKKSWNGQAQRRELLERSGLELPVTLHNLAGQVPVDDVLDAAVAAWTAVRYTHGTAQSFPDDDALPNAARIWY